MFKKCIVVISVVFFVCYFNDLLKGESKQSEEPEWLNSKAGITDEVLAPWIPIEVEQLKNGRNLKVKVWGRVYYFNDNPFPVSIEIKGKSILAGQIRIIAKVDGEIISWKGEFQKIKEQKPNIVCLTQSASGGGLKLSIDTQIEYDGMVRFDWRVVPKRSLNLEELIFEIPLSSRYAKYNYYPGFTTKVGFVPKNKNTGKFQPMIWFGDEECGLEWFCESEKDWYNVKSTRRIEVLPQNNTVALRLHLVDKSIHLTPGERVHHESGISVMQPEDNVVELSYTFGIQATPVKPIEKDVWDYRTIHLGAFGEGKTPKSGDRFNVSEQFLDSFAKWGVRTAVIHDYWTDIFGSTTTTYDKDLKPVYDKAFKNMIKNLHVRGINLLPYFGPMMSDVEPLYPLFNEKCLIMPKSAWSETYYLNMPPMLAQIPYSVCYRSVWQNYLVDGIDRMMKEYDIDGVYLDGVGLAGYVGCSNTLHGCGYIGLDGKVHGTYAIFPNRQVMRRIYTVVKKHKPDGQVNFHNSLEMLAPVLSWATSYWDGEHLGNVVSNYRALPKSAPLLEKMPLDCFRTEFMGHQWGVPAEFLGEVISDYLVGSLRVTLALSLLHDVPVRSNAAYDIYEIWKTFDEFGRKQAEWLPYWKNKEYVTVKPEGGVRLSSAEVKDVYVSLYQHPKNGVLVVVANLGLENTKVEVQLNLQKLKLKGQLSAYDVLDKNQVSITDDGTFEVPLNFENFRVIWIKEGVD